MLTEPSRRRNLRVAFKLLALTAAITVAAVLFSSLESPRHPSATVVTVPLTELLPGEPRVIDWGGRPILVLKRSADQHAAVAGPAAANGLLVAYAVGRGAGCPLTFTGDALQDRCDGARYDLAGRAFPESETARNLAVPPHHVRDGRLVIGSAG